MAFRFGILCCFFILLFHAGPSFAATYVFPTDLDVAENAIAALYDKYDKKFFESDEDYYQRYVNGISAASQLLSELNTSPVPDWTTQNEYKDDWQDPAKKAWAVVLYAVKRDFYRNIDGRFTAIEAYSSSSILIGHMADQIASLKSTMTTDVGLTPSASSETLTQKYQKAQLIRHWAEVMLDAAFAFTPHIPAATPDWGAKTEQATLASEYKAMEFLKSQVEGGLPGSGIPAIDAGLDIAGGLNTALDTYRTLKDLSQLLYSFWDDVNLDNARQLMVTGDMSHFGITWDSLNLPRARYDGQTWFVPASTSVDLDSMCSDLTTIINAAESWEEYYQENHTGLESGRIVLASVLGGGYLDHGGSGRIVKESSPNSLLGVPLPSSVSISKGEWILYVFRNKQLLGDASSPSPFNAKNLAGGKLRVTIQANQYPSDMKFYLSNSSPDTSGSLSSAPANGKDVTPGVFNWQRILGTNGFTVSSTIEPASSGSTDSTTGWDAGTFDGAWNSRGEMFMLVYAKDVDAIETIIHSIEISVEYPSIKASGDVVDHSGEEIVGGGVQISPEDNAFPPMTASSNNGYSIEIPRYAEDGSEQQYTICGVHDTYETRSLITFTATGDKSYDIVMVRPPQILMTDPDVGAAREVGVPGNRTTYYLDGTIDTTDCPLPVSFSVQERGTTTAIGTYESEGVFNWTLLVEFESDEYGSWNFDLKTTDGENTQRIDSRTLRRPDPAGDPVPVLSVYSTEADGKTYVGASKLKNLVPGQTQKVTFLLQNTGGYTETGYLSISCTTGLEIVGANDGTIDPAVYNSFYSDGVRIYNHPIGHSPIYTDSGSTITAVNQLVDMTASYGYGAYKLMTITVRAKDSVGESDRLLYRAAFKGDLEDEYHRTPSSGVDDQQDWACNTFGVSGSLPGIQSLSATLDGDNANLAWSNVDGLKSYSVYQGNSPDLASASLVASHIGGSTTKVLLSAFEDNYFWVVGYDEYGVSSGYTACEQGKIVYHPAAENGLVTIPSMSGNKNRTLPASGSPYYLSRDLFVYDGYSLTIEPGVVIKLYDVDTDIRVYGTLKAQGTSSSPIVFTHRNDNEYGGATYTGSSVPYRGAWGAIELRGGNNAISHCLFRYGGNNYYSNGAVMVTGDNARIIDSHFEHCEDAIWIQNSSAVVDGCTIEDSDNGVCMRNADPVIRNSTFSGNDWPLSIDEACTPTYSGNTFSENTYDAVYVKNSSLDRDTTWGIVQDDIDTYYLSSDVSVEEGTTLTINPGVVVKAYTNTTDLRVYGILKAVGTSSDPIVFTHYYDNEYGGATYAGSNSPYKGAWGGVELRGDSNTISRCLFRYGGNNYYSNGALVMVGNDVLVSNSRFEHCEDAIWIQSSSAVVDGCTIEDNDNGVCMWNADPVIRNSTFSGNDWPLSIDEACTPTYSGNTFSENTYDAVYVKNSSLDRDTTWGIVQDDIDTYYLSSDVSVEEGTTLTINPGVVVKAYTNTTDLRVYGILKAVGTSSDPIVFTHYYDNEYGGATYAGSNSPYKGAWGGVELRGDSNTISRCLFRYGGNNYYSNGAVMVTGDNARIIDSHFEHCEDAIWIQNSSAVVDGCTIEDNDNGVCMRNADPVIRNSTFSGNDWPLSIDEACTPIYSGNTFSENTYDAVYVKNSSLDRDTTWGIVQDDIDTYYLSSDVSVEEGTTLTINPGVVVKAYSGTTDLRVYGVLEAVGTASAPIVFTHRYDKAYGGDVYTGTSAPYPGAWGTVDLRGAGSRLVHCHFRYGGSSSNYDYALRVLGNASVESGRFESCYNGVYLEDAVLIMRDTVFTGNNTGFAFSGMIGATVVTGCSFLDNALYDATRESGTETLDAADNYWGAASGPGDSLGAGITVSSFLSVDPNRVVLFSPAPIMLLLQ